MKSAEAVFKDYLKSKNLNQTKQRQEILKLFLKEESHFSADDLYRMLRKDDPSIGYTTVYRTLRLICDCGIGCAVDIGDNVFRVEHNYMHKHHDHLICIKCGEVFEVMDEEIEDLQNRLAHRHRFYPTNHKMEIFGYCIKCKK